MHARTHNTHTHTQRHKISKAERLLWGGVVTDGSEAPVEEMCAEELRGSKTVLTSPPAMAGAQSPSKLCGRDRPGKMRST